MTATPLLALLASGLAADPVRFTAHSASGFPKTGELRWWTADGRVALADPAAEFVAGDVYSLRRVGRPLAMTRTAQVVFANGDRLSAEVRGGKGANVLVATSHAPAGTNWVVPLSALAALWFWPHDPGYAAHETFRPAGAKGDVLLYVNEDTETATVESVSADGSELRLAAERGKPARVVPTVKLRAVAFDPALVRLRPPKGKHYRLVTDDGDRLTATDLWSEHDRFRGTNLFGGRLQFSFGRVLAVDVVGGKATPLSDLKPSRSAVEGFAGTGVPWAADRTVKGLPLRLAAPDSGTYDKGLGTHPRTTLTYALGGKYRRFEATVGLDPATGRRGAAVARVLVDGKPAAAPGLEALAAASPPVPVRIDVTGAKELFLVVDFGPAGDVQADINWADARLVE